MKTTNKQTIKQTLTQLKEALAATKAKYDEVVHTASPADVRPISQRIRELQKAISDAIVDGAEPCPACGTAPVGIEQPKEKGGFEYEIGCPNCKPILHTDKTMRDPRVRGGMMPHHAVEAWNAGPDYWRISKVDAPEVPAAEPSAEDEPS